MQQYLNHMGSLLQSGTMKEDRTGTGTLSIFGHQMRFDLREGFPLVTTKKCHLKSIIHELLWFLKGDTNIKYLNDNDVKIWDEWADQNGNLGPIYGKQWRSWETNVLEDDGDLDDFYALDQIATVIDQLKTDPDSRRMIVSAWNAPEVEDMALAPCHTMFQFYTEEIPQHQRVEIAKQRIRRDQIEELKFIPPGGLDAFLEQHEIPKRYLSCQLYQRSADWFLGVPFNIASYSLLTMMIAKVVNMVPKDFIHSFGDTHLYSNHVDQAEEQLPREPLPLPTMIIKDRGQGIDDFVYEDFELVGYESHDAISAPVAV